MAAQSFYMIGFLLLLFLIIFLGYYGWRLVGARKSKDDSDQRLQALFREQLRSQAPASPSSTGGPTSTGSAAPPAAAAAAATWGSPLAPPPTSQTMAYDKRLGLASLSAEPIFIRRTGSGDISIQLGGKPPMPLNFVLDPKVRSALQQVVMQATVDLGPSWSIIAGDDPEGRLQITRLT